LRSKNHAVMQSPEALRLNFDSPNLMIIIFYDQI
jgi:hypothetical protein